MEIKIRKINRIAPVLEDGLMRYNLPLQKNVSDDFLRLRFSDYGIGVVN